MIFQKKEEGRSPSLQDRRFRRSLSGVLGLSLVFLAVVSALPGTAGCSSKDLQSFEMSAIETTLMREGPGPQAQDTAAALESMQSITDGFDQALQARDEAALNEAVNAMEKKMLALRQLSVPEALEGVRQLQIEKGRLIQKALRALLRKDAEMAKEVAQEVLALDEAIQSALQKIRSEATVP